MTVGEPDGVGDRAMGTGGGGTGDALLAPEEQGACWRGEHAFPDEADTLTTHGMGTLLPRPDESDDVPGPPDHLDEDVMEASIAQASRREDATSPTLSLAQQSDAAREVYRRFLASEYAPALDLADELIAQGDHDPLLVTIARECRTSLAGERAGAVAPLETARDDGPHVGALAGVRGTTLDQLAARMGTSLEHLLRLLERSIMTSAPPLRPRGR